MEKKTTVTMKEYGQGTRELGVFPNKKIRCIYNECSTLYMQAMLWRFAHEGDAPCRKVIVAKYMVLIATKGVT